MRDSSGLADRRCRARRTGDLLSELKRVTSRGEEEDAPACASRYRNGATQRSHSRDTRAGGGASLHREAVAHVEAEHTDALLVRSSGDADTVAVRRSKSEQAAPHRADRGGRGVLLAALSRSTGGELMFRRTSGSRWKTSEQARPMRADCARAGVKPAASFHILRYT